MALSTMSWVYVGVLALFAAAFVQTFLKLRNIAPADAQTPTASEAAPPADARAGPTAEETRE